METWGGFDLEAKYGVLPWTDRRRSEVRLNCQVRGHNFQRTSTLHMLDSVVLLQHVVDRLRGIRGDQLVSQARLGPAWQNTGFVFTRPDGRPADPDDVTRTFIATALSLGIKGVRLHDLRHTHATLMLAANIHPKVVSERLGHASVTITMDICSHVLPGIQRDAAEKFSRVLSDSPGGLSD